MSGNFKELVHASMSWIEYLIVAAAFAGFIWILLVEYLIRRRKVVKPKKKSENASRCRCPQNHKEETQFNYRNGWRM